MNRWGSRVAAIERHTTSPGEPAHCCEPLRVTVPVKPPPGSRATETTPPA